MNGYLKMLGALTLLVGAGALCDVAITSYQRWREKSHSVGLRLSLIESRLTYFENIERERRAQLRVEEPAPDLKG